MANKLDDMPVTKEKSDKDDKTVRQSPLFAAAKELIGLLNDGGRDLIQNERLYVYSEGAWDTIDLRLQEELDTHLMKACLGVGSEYGKEHKAAWKTVVTHITAPMVEFDKDPLIAMPKGTLDPRHDDPEVLPHDREHYITRRIAIQYVPGAKCPEWEAMLLRMLEHPDRTPEDAVKMAKALQQWVGINIVGPRAKVNRQLQKGLIIEGASGTGKTTFARVVGELFGTARVVSSHLSELGSNFGKSVLINAQALISDDGIEPKTDADPRLLKAIVTGENMTVDRKFKDHISFKFQGAVLFTTNVLPNIRDESSAVYNRFMLVRMDRIFTAADQKKQLRGMDPIDYLKKKKEFPGILNWALDGFREAYDQGFFSLPPEVQDAADVFRSRNDPVFAFTKECVSSGDKYIPARALTAMCMEYAMATHSVNKMSAKTTHASLQKVVREVYDGVKFETEGGARNVVGYIGVELTELGLAHWQKVRDKGVAGLEGMVSPYIKRV